jgi:hypothetical protein
MKIRHSDMTLISHGSNRLGQKRPEANVVELLAHLGKVQDLIVNNFLPM